MFPVGLSDFVLSSLLVMILFSFYFWRGLDEGFQLVFL